MGATLLKKKFPSIRILVVIPTDALQKQWIKELHEWDLDFNSEVVIINSLLKHSYTCDLLILDECHRYASDENKKVFDVVQYKYILGLSATMERLDGKHELFNRYCPVVDRINDLEAIANGWVAESKEYKVIIDLSPEEIEEYKILTREFNEHFEFFNYNFDLVMSMLGPDGFVMKAKYRDSILAAEKWNDQTSQAYKDRSVELFRNINYHSVAFARCMQARKKFINCHPRKLELAREIIKHRPQSKIITFSATVDIAESIGVGKVYSGKVTKKKGRITLDEFARMEAGVLNTVKKCDEGLDCPGINLAIILGYDSSPTRYKQRKGRAIRKEGSKIAELFTFVINDTVETEWFKKSHGEAEVIPIDVNNLFKVLKGEPYETYKRPVSKFTFRF